MGEDQSPQILKALRNATESAARAAFEQIGCGRAESVDGAAAQAMSEALAGLPFAVRIAIGEGREGEVSDLYDGQVIGGDQENPQFDLAVDSGEGTTYLVDGFTNAMTVLALAPLGAMKVPSPALYMEKFAAPPAAKGEIDPRWPVGEKLAALGKLLGKEIGELNIFVLEKPRHRALIDQILELGAQVTSLPAGDIAGALLSALPNSGVDALMGSGGVREGILSACAARALGAEFQGRIDPQLQSEQAAVERAGLDLTRWMPAAEFVASEDTYFCATGIATGLLLEGVERVEGRDRVQTLKISGATGESQLQTTWRRIASHV
ncbi:MAG: fructose-bisphosphatase class II [Deltaproteobacteria bacterium]|jgi:fructose-1,6-bisphosphatase II|nr:fructose-bisphosphatase class II [Deltaproteobacteria bacterium]MBW2540839.1 fructose-bisphosphatase class II [Deltaproteobacteria bacterium]